MTLETERGWEVSFHQDEDEEDNSSRIFDGLLHENQTSQLTPFNDKKSITQDQKSDARLQDYSSLFTAKTPIVQKTYKSLIPEAMNKKIKTVKSQIVVYFFNTNKRIVFTRNELKQHFGEDNKMPPTIKNFIPFIVKQYCKLFLYFDPLEVNHEYFQLKVANQKNQDDQMLYAFSHDEDFNWLFECVSLVLVRKKKSTERILAWQQKIKDDKSVLEIIIPFQRQLLEKIEKNKTIYSLKQKIISYSQMSNIVIVTYHDLKVCEGKKKISQIIETDRVLEVYRQKVNKYEDIPVPIQSMKAKKSELTNDLNFLIKRQFRVNSTFFFGTQFLVVNGTQIIEKYEAGLLGLFLPEITMHKRSVHTLVGLGCIGRTLKMQFITKDGSQTCSYRFNSKYHKQEFLKLILKIGRELSQNFENILK